MNDTDPTTYNVPEETEPTQAEYEAKVVETLKRASSKMDELLDNPDDSDVKHSTSQAETDDTLTVEKAYLPLGNGIRISRMKNSRDGELVGTKYTLSQTSKTVPKQPDGSQSNYNPYDFTSSDTTWEFDPRGELVEQQHNATPPYPDANATPEDRAAYITTGQVSVTGFNSVHTGAKSGKRVDTYGIGVVLQSGIEGRAREAASKKGKRFGAKLLAKLRRQ